MVKSKEEIIIVPEHNKPVIETIINTCALALTSFGVLTATSNGGTWETLTKGMVLVLFGAGLEFLKYYGRNKQLW